MSDDTFMMPHSLQPEPDGYREWLMDLKTQIYTAQQQASRTVNYALIEMYWHIGNDILTRQKTLGWGTKVIERLAHDLRTTFPDMQGFSRTNLMYMRSFAEAWPDKSIVQQLVGQLPWGHNLILITKLKDEKLRLSYASQAIEHGWSRNILTTHINTQSLERSGKSTTNFPNRLPQPLSDLAQESLKDPYCFDFLGITPETNERDLEKALIQHVTDFLIELGAGFAFVGRQVLIQVGGDDFFIDLLFYHLKLRCYVVIELKAGKFKPEHLGQLGFYLTAVDEQIKHPDDGQTIGLLLCQSKNKIVAEYALRDTSQPIGVSEYQLVASLPPDLQNNLPSIHQIERELANNTPLL